MSSDFSISPVADRDGSAPSLAEGVIAARPARGILVGDLYLSIDEQKLYRWDGTAWDVVLQAGSVPSDAITGTLLQTFIPVATGTHTIGNSQMQVLNAGTYLVSNYAQVSIRKLTTGGSAATIIINAAGAGAGSTASISGTDLAGNLTITATSPVSNAKIATVNFSSSFTAIPSCVLITPANEFTSELQVDTSGGSGLIQQLYVPKSSLTATSFEIWSNRNATDPNAGTYLFFYIVIM